MGSKYMVTNFLGKIASLFPDRIKCAVYERPIVGSLLRRLLNPLFPTGPIRVKIQGGLLRGSHIIADLSQGEKSYWLGTYETDVQSTIRELSRECPGLKVIYDVGAHIGIFSMAFAHLFPNSLVYAFEPNQQNLHRLKANIKINMLTKSVIPLPYALSACSGEDEFFIGNSTWSGSLIRDHRDTFHSNYKVQTITLDELVYERGYEPPDLIKLDVEGSEGDVLLGALRLLNEHKPIFIIEVHHPSTGAQVLSILKDSGYSFFRYSKELQREHVAFYEGHFIARCWR